MEARPGPEIGATRVRNVLATLTPMFVAFVGILVLQLTSVAQPRTLLFSTALTLLLGFGPFAGEVAEAFRSLPKSGLVALGALEWLTIALLVWKSRAGNGHWILYAAASTVWLGVGLVAIAYAGRNV